MVARLIKWMMDTIIDQDIWLVCNDEVNTWSAFIHDMCCLVNKLSQIIVFNEFIKGNALLIFNVARPPLLAPAIKITSENYAVRLFITHIVQK